MFILLALSPKDMIKAQDEFVLVLRSSAFVPILLIKGYSFNEIAVGPEMGDRECFCH